MTVYGRPGYTADQAAIYAAQLVARRRASFWRGVGFALMFISAMIAVAVVL